MFKSTLSPLLFLGIFCAALPAQLKAQVYEIDNVNGQTINTCSGTFYDAGGANGGYTAGQIYSVTFCSGQANFGVSIDFSQIAIPFGSGELCIYDGPDAAAPLLACINDAFPQTPAISSASNLSNCLTLEFISTGNGAGWTANISCVVPCQAIDAVLTGILVGQTPIIPPVQYVDLCPGDFIRLAASALFPENGLYYTQDILTSTFEWDYGDGLGTSVGALGQYIFTNPGGYNVYLNVTDVQGCETGFVIAQKVRVGTAPTFEEITSSQDTICLGDTVTLFGNSTPTIGTFAPPFVTSDSLFLPDVPGGQVTSYSTSVTVNSFAPGASVQSVNDIAGICMLLEHSYLGDLQIVVTCPSGNSVIVKQFPGGGGTQLGEPVDDQLSLTPGDGYNYCFTNTPTFGTMVDEAGIYTHSYVDNDGTPVNNVAFLPPGDYTPFEPFTQFIGCPLNGTWTITFTDNLGVDNGYLFNWSIQFDPTLYPNLEAFAPTVVDSFWVADPTIITNAGGVATASPNQPGIAQYTYSVLDDFGCTYDTTVNIVVLPPSNPLCLNCNLFNASILNPLQDTSICVGQSVQLEAFLSSDTVVGVPICDQYDVLPIPHAPVAGSGTSVTLADDQVSNALPIGFNFEFFCNTYNNFYICSNGFITFTPGSPATFPGQVIPNPLAANNLIAMAWEDLNPPGNGTIEYYTVGVAPNRTLVVEFDGVASYPGSTPAVTGQILLRETSNIIEIHATDIGGANLTNTTMGIEDLNGQAAYVVPGRNSSTWTAVNEGWRFAPISGIPPFSGVYSWQPALGLDNANIANPVATPAQTTTYVMSVSPFSVPQCVYTDTVTVNIGSPFAAPVLACGTATTNTLQFTWSAVPGASGYEVSTDGITWIPVGNVLDYTVTGLGINQTVTLFVRATGGPCPPNPQSSLSCTTLNCSLTLVIDSTSQADCGLSNGAIYATATGFVGSPTFTLQPVNIIQATGVFTNLASGAYTVEVTDSAGCIVSLPANVSSLSNVVLLTQELSPVSCFGGADGQAVVTASGGSGNYTYSWNNGQTDDTLNNVAAGLYEVIVDDGTGCPVVGTVLVTEPTAIDLSNLQVSNINCAGALNGQISIAPTGGTPGYTYLWSTGATNDTIFNVVAGNYSLTVTDANGCTADTSLTLTDPLPVQVTFDDPTPVICFGGTNGIAIVTASGGTGPYTYFWSNGDTTPTVTQLAMGVYYVTATDAFGCVASDSVIVSEYPELIAVVTTTAACDNGANGTATVNASGGGGAYDYEWETSEQTQTISNLTSSDYEVTVTDNNGCTVVANDSVDSNPAIVLNLSSLQTCFNINSGTAWVNASGGTAPFTYLWSNNAITDTIYNVGTGNYVVSVTDAAGCSNTANVSVSPTPAFSVFTEFDTVACFGGTDAAVWVFINGTGIPPFTYLWDNGSTNDTITNVAAGVYTVTATDSYGCSASLQTNIIEPPLLNISINPLPFFCFGGTNGVLTTVSNGGVQPYTYLWSDGQTSAAATELPADSYTVTITDANGCTASNTYAIIEDLPIQMTLTASDACGNEANGSAEAVATGGFGLFNYEWSNGSFDASQPNITGGIYYVTATDAHNCPINDSIVVNIVPPPTLNPYGGMPGLDTVSIFEGQSTTISAGADEPGVAYLWIPADGLQDPTAATTIAAPLVTTTYLVIATNSPCIDTGFVTVIVDETPPRVTMPNAFAPNASQQENSLFRPIVEGTAELVSFRIFNRWGQLVFDDVTNGWDGTFNGSEQPRDVYVWVIEYRVDGATTLTQKGDVTLLR